MNDRQEKIALDNNPGSCHLVICCRLISIAATASVVWLCLACSKDTPTRLEEPGWHSLGFENYRAADLEVAYPYVYAVAWDDGLFRRRISSGDNVWEYLGFAHVDMADTTMEPGTHIYASAVLTLGSGEVLAGIVSWVPGLPALYRSTNGGRSWQSPYKGIADTLCLSSNIFSLEACLRQPAVCFAATQGAIYRSEDAGMSWTRIFGYCGGLGIDQLKVHPQNCDIIWAAGETNRFEHYLITSRDGGATWRVIDPGDIVYGMRAVGQVFLDPFDDAVAYLTATGGPIVTEDGGQTWRSLSFEWAPDGFSFIVFDPRRRGHLFVRAGDLYESWDGGETAQALMSPHKTSILDMEYDSRRQTLYVGTRSGVYRYVTS